MRASAPSGLVFLSVPDFLCGNLSADFAVDPSIPIPVSLNPGDDNLDLKNLSWEMILSGMIRAVMENPAGADAPYYRRFVLTVKPELMAEFIQAAVVKTKNGDYKTALEIASALEGIFPDGAEVLNCRAFILEEQANALEKSGMEAEADAVYDSAYTAYQKLALLKPPYADGLFNAAYFFMKRRNYDMAKECFLLYLDGADSSDPKREEARRILGEIESYGLDDAAFRTAYNFIRLGEVEQGLLKIRGFLERHPSVWNGWFILGWGLRKLGRWEDGIAAFRKSIELGGGNSDTRNELAICLMECGDLAGARKELEESLKEEPENVKIISNLGVLALKSGDEHSASGFFRILLELEPNDPVALEYFRRGE